MAFFAELFGRAFKPRFAAAGMGLVIGLGLLAGCSQPMSAALQPVKTDAKTLGQRADKLMAEDFKLKADPKKGPPDIAGLAAALPKPLKLTWDKLDFDAASGANVLHGVKLTPADNPAIGLSIAELKVWGLDSDFAKARLSGQRLAESGPLARRIDAKTVSVFGLDTLMAPAMKASTDAAVAAATALSPEASAAAKAASDLQLKSYQISLGRLVLDDVRLRPWELQKKELTDATWKDILPLAQSAAAAYRTFAVDTAVSSDLKIQFAYDQAGQASSMAVDMARLAYRGIRGGDMDLALLDGMKMELDLTTPATANAKPIPVKMAATIDRYSMENVRLDKLLGYLARGVVPPRTETNLLSLGVLRFTNQRYAFNGRDAYAVGSGLMDMSSFYWFIPTHLSFESKDVAYNTPGLLGWIEDVAKAENPGSANQVDPKVLDLLKRHKLEKPTMDTLLGWDWNPTTGAAHIDGGFGLHDYFTLDLKTDLGLPSFKSVSDLVPGGFDTAKQDEIAKLFQNSATLVSGEMSLVDKGGLDEGFALAVELPSVAPPDDTTFGFLKNRTPASLRQLAYSGLYALGDTVAKDNPKMRDLVRACAAFVEKGGVLRLKLKPDKPVSVSALSDASLTPTQVFDMLHLSLVNEPAAGAKKN